MLSAIAYRRVGISGTAEELPGDVLLVRYNGAFFEVYGETEKYIRVRSRKVWAKRHIDPWYKDINEEIENGLFLLGRIYNFWDDKRKEMHREIKEDVDGDVWRPSEDELFYEVTFDLEKLRKYRVDIGPYEPPGPDFYLYGRKMYPISCRV